MIYLILAKGLAALDLFIKAGVEQLPQSAFPGVLKGTNGRIKLHRVKNEGLPFGTYAGQFVATTVLPFFMLCICIFRLLHMVCQGKEDGNNKSAWKKLGLSLIVGGGISNVADRLRKGYVLDYFSLDLPGCKWLKNTIFNLGDVFIFVGTFLTVIAAIGKEGKQK